MISLIIPVFNNKNTLENCINSVVEENIDDMEVIIVDDGSEDNYAQIICKYKKNDQVKFIRQKHQGPSAARNKGLENAKGEYIVFVDADDVIVKDGIRTLKKYIEKSDLVIGNVIKRNSPDIKYNYVINRDVGIHLFFEQNENRILGTVYGKMFKRELINHTFDEDIFIGEDALFLLKYLLNCSCIYMIKDCVYHHIMNENGLRNSASDEQYYTMIMSSLKMCQYLTEHDDKYKTLAIRNLLSNFLLLSQCKKNINLDQKMIAAIADFFANLK